MQRLYFLGNARTDQQRQDMLTKEAVGLCIFCPSTLQADPDHHVIVDFTNWMVTSNKYPYAGTKLHLLVIPKQHVTKLTELPAEAFLELQMVLSKIELLYELTYYGLGARCGDCRYTGGTIVHLHIHVLVGHADGNSQKLRMSFSSTGEF